jgi:hypothetical protein
MKNNKNNIEVTMFYDTKLEIYTPACSNNKKNGQCEFYDGSFTGNNKNGECCYFSYNDYSCQSPAAQLEALKNIFNELYEIIEDVKDED